MSTAQVITPETAPPPAQSNSELFLGCALPLIDKGIKVIRLISGDKAPFDKNWPALATTDEATVRQWGESTPGANCGCVADYREDGYFFFESDSPDVQARYQRDTGKELPVTFKVESRPDRFHYYFRHTPYSFEKLTNISQNIVKHKDFSVRVKDQFVVSCGSVHPITKKHYRIRKNVPMAPVPDELVDWLLAQKETEQMAPTLNGPIILWGSQDIELTRIAGRLRWSGAGEKTIAAALIEACEDRCPDRGPDYIEMCEKIAHSIAKKEPGDCKEYTVIIGSAAPAPIAIDEYQPATVSANQDDPEDARMREALERFKDVPAFDPAVMTGVCKDFVELAIRGTTLQPQFVFTGIKTIIGAIMSSKGVKYDLLDDEAPRYVGNMGYTGSGKGASLKRIQTIIFNDELLSGAGCDLKLLEAIDSAAGLKDLFFEPPEKAPVLYLCDEVSTLSNRTKESRDPGILDLIGELANKTIVSRVLAKRSGGAKQKGDCRLVMLACGPDGEAFTELGSNRTTKGLLDRIIPEYGVPVEGDDLPRSPSWKPWRSSAKSKICRIWGRKVRRAQWLCPPRLRQRWISSGGSNRSGFKRKFGSRMGCGSTAT